MKKGPRCSPSLISLLKAITGGTDISTLLPIVTEAKFVIQERIDIPPDFGCSTNIYFHKYILHTDAYALLHHPAGDFSFTDALFDERTGCTTGSS